MSDKNKTADQIIQESFEEMFDVTAPEKFLADGRAMAHEMMVDCVSYAQDQESLGHNLCVLNCQAANVLAHTILNVRDQKNLTREEALAQITKMIELELNYIESLPVSSRSFVGIGGVPTPDKSTLN